MDFDGIIKEIDTVLVVSVKPIFAFTKCKYRFDTDNKNNQPLWDLNDISHVWPEPPFKGQLHIYITLRTSMGSSTLFQGVGESVIRPFARSGHLTKTRTGIAEENNVLNSELTREYQDISS